MNLTDFDSDYVNPLLIKLFKGKEKGLLEDEYNTDFSKYGQHCLNNNFLDDFIVSVFFS